jgi:hypothetical protein
MTARDAALDWVLEQITAWRREADVQWRPDRVGLNDGLKSLQAAGIPEGLAAYVVLGCEWLWRVVKTGDEDVEEFLIAVENALSNIMAPPVAFWVTEALAGPLKEKLKREGRKLLALGTYLPGPALGFRSLFAPHEPVRRVRPEPVVPRVRGRIPWPAPWVAGAIIRELLQKRSAKDRRLPLEITRALYGGRQVEAIEFKTQTAVLTSEVLQWWVDGFEHRYQQFLRMTAAPPEDWGAMWRSHLAVLEPGATFPSDPERAREILEAYGASGRKRFQKPT